MKEDQDRQSGDWGALAAFKTQRDGHGDSNRSFWVFTLFFILLALVGIGYYTYYQASGATYFSKTLSENVDLENGLVGHWTFDGDQTDWASTTGEVINRGSVGGRGDVTNFTKSQVAIGKVGQALLFAGSDDYVETATDLFDFERTEPFSISVWYENTGSAAGSARSLGGNANNALDSRGWLFGLKGGGLCGTNAYLGFYFANNTSNGITVCTTNQISLSGWHHAVVTYDGLSSASGVKIYVDGVSQTLTTPNDNLSATTLSTLKMRIGDDQTADFWQGKIDDFRVYDRELDVAEVEALYSLGEGTKIQVTDTPTNLDSGLVGHWTFDGVDMDWASSTGEVRDRGSSGVRGNATNLTSRNAVLGKIGQAISFQGSGGQKIDIGSPDAFDDLESQGGGGMTVSAWINPRSQGENSEGVIVDKNNISTISNGAWALKLSGTRAISFEKSYDTTPLVRGTSNNLISLGQWHYVTMTWDGTASASNIHIYINGAEASYQGAINGSGNKLSDAANSLAINDQVGNREFDGTIDDVRIYNRALSADEVAQLYSIGLGSTIE